MTDPDPTCRPSSADLTQHKVLCPFANKSKVGSALFAMS